MLTIGLMATKTITTTKFIDDLDGGDAVETVSFAVDGKMLEIDLSEQNAKALRSAFDKYVSAARKTTKSGKSVTRTRSDVDPATVRAWAAAQGIAVNPRGRLKADVVAQFRDAGN
jgi:hypothetical protein